jgi:hypothetical protein
MPLPADGTEWPPSDARRARRKQDELRAWWSGEPDKLRSAAGEGQQAEPGRPRFWQRRATGDTTSATKALHAPLAADITTASADVLFGEPPTLTVPTDVDGAEQTQGRLDELAAQLGLSNTLLAGAETCAAVGGVYLRPIWDRDVADHPLLTVVPAERAVPDFAYGRLVAVTFYEKVYDDDGKVGWHLERHEPGSIEHALYEGSWIDLGRRVALARHPLTAAFPDVVTDHAPIPGLLVSYVPNALPNRLWPDLPIGRSDLAGSEGFLDSLDEAWSSWMRDLRLGQARIFADTSVLRPPTVGAKPGAGRGFDVDQELITEVNMTDSDELLKPQQFAVRVQEHQQTTVALTEAVISAAGYSPQTFGLHIEGRAESGTALRIREGKTFRTQGRKQRYWQPAVERSTEMLLALDNVVFGRPTPPARPKLTWGEIADDPEGGARWVQTLRQAHAASIRAAVQLSRPDLDDDQVEAEVSEIRTEQGVGVEPPEVELP